MQDTVHYHKGVILVGHGAVAKDCPRELVVQLKTLEGRRQASGTAPSAEESELERRIRTWPRTPATDPYQAGIQALANSLRSLLHDVRFGVAYLEFCAPTLDAVIAEFIAAGVKEIVTIPSMLTPGGVHSEVDIPEMLAELRGRYPDITLRYAWPVDLNLMARFLAEHLTPFLS
jgi:sirohydrochlorin cobaltochelatase